MKIILAQGNPGSEYARTRHNIGWQCLDALACACGAQFATKPKLHAATASATIAGQPVLLAKPTTFYNDTGRLMTCLLSMTS